MASNYKCATGSFYLYNLKLFWYCSKCLYVHMCWKFLLVFYARVFCYMLCHDEHASMLYCASLFSGRKAFELCLFASFIQVMCGLGYNYKLKANKFSCFLPKRHTVNFLSMPAHNVLFQDIVKDKTRLGQINM